MNEDPPIEITILDETETPLVTEETKSPAKKVADQLTSQAAKTAKRAWQSDTRKQVTGKLQQGATSALQKGNQAVQQKINEAVEKRVKEEVAAARQQIQQTDWTEVARTSISQGLKWASHRPKRPLQQINPNTTNSR